MTRPAVILEEEIFRQPRGLECQLLAEAAQKKADQPPPVCPVCGQARTRRMPAPERTCQPRFGPVTIRRLRGWCRRCRAWRFPADPALGLSDPGRASPSVQEASAVSERLTGGKLPPATLERATRRQGQRAEQKRTQQDEAFIGRETFSRNDRWHLRCPHPTRSNPPKN